VKRLILVAVVIASGLLIGCTGNSERLTCDSNGIHAAYLQAASLDHRLHLNPKAAGTLNPDLRALWGRDIDCSHHPELSSKAHSEYAMTLLMANADGALIEYANKNDPAARRYAGRFLFLAQIIEGGDPTGGFASVIDYARSMQPEIAEYDRMLRRKGIPRAQINEKQIMALRPVR